MAEAAKRALITGVTGQDGMYLAELLHQKGYKVFGLVRGQNNPKKGVVADELPFVEVVEADLLDLSSLVRALEHIQPQEIYNLAAISFVGFSFHQPITTAQVTGVGVANLLEAIRLTGQEKTARFYQASTSELYGKVVEVPQKETTPFHPRSPYGAAKAYAHYMTLNYRESYGMFASCGILFNHESPRRGYEFVTRKVTSSVARIKLGLQKEIVMGNLDAKRDWGFAGDYVRGMWMMLQQDKPDDFILATGETRTIKELLEVAFNEVGIDDWKPYVRQAPEFMRPSEVDLLLGDPSKAKKQLGWEPEVNFKQLISMMVAHDLDNEKARSAK